MGRRGAVLHRSIASDRRPAGKARERGAKARVSQRPDAARSSIYLTFAIGLLLAALVATSARAEIDPFYDAQKICRDFLPGFVAAPIRLERDPVRWIDDGHTLIAWRWEGDRLAPDDAAGWLACWFLPLQQSGGRWQIARLESARYGLMTRYDVQQLYKLLHILPGASHSGDEPAADYGLGYVLQQSVNALALG